MIAWQKSEDGEELDSSEKFYKAMENESDCSMRWAVSAELVGVGLSLSLGALQVFFPSLP